jgi:cytochrome P450
MWRLTHAVFAAGNPGIVPTDDAEVFAGLMEFYEYFEHIAQARLQHPTDDLSTVLARATIEGQPLGQLERFSYLVVLITAGHDTTASALSGGIEALLRHPDQLRRLRHNPDGVNHAVEEIVRWVSPVKHFMRYATEDYRLRGRLIEAGQGVLLSFPSANRDEAVFDQPDSFDVERDDVDNHLGFGFGAHFCLGAHLARIELQAFFGHFVRRLADGEILDGARDTHSTLVSGFRKLSARCTFGPTGTL